MPKSSHRKKEKQSRRKPLPHVGISLNKPKLSGEIILQAEASDIQFTSNADIAEERKKRRLIALSFCDFVSQDVQGKMNLMGCFDNIYRDKETKQTGHFYIYIRTAGRMDGRTEVTFLDPNDKPVVQVGYDATTKEVPHGKPSHVQFFARINFVAEEKGVYWVDVTYEGESLGGRDLTISERES